MQNMIRIEDSIGTIHVYFDVKDGNIVNVKAQDEKGDMRLNDTALKEWCAREYAETVLQMALIYKDGMVPLKC